MGKRMPCPSCGAMARHINVDATLKVDVNPDLSFKYTWTEAGKGKPTVEQIAGNVPRRSTGGWAFQFRRIDRLRNWYSELVRDKETGQIIHQCAEPLNRHQGHGSARKKKLAQPVQGK